MAIIGKKSVTDGIKLDGKVNVFQKLYEDQQRAVWFPQELNINQDLLDWQNMPPKEKDLFNNLVGYFVTSELLVQNVIGESFFPYILDPWAKSAMSVQMFMESVHSQFFEIVLNTFSMDRNKLYNMTTDHPLLRKKQERVAEAADLISVSGGGVDPETLEGKKAILHSILLSSIIQEGIFFYSAFALFLAMRETGKMKNVCNGIDLIIIDESLHLKLGIELILGVLEETPEISQDLAFVNKIRDTIVQCAELEFEFIREQFGSNTILDISGAEMIEYLKYITDRRMEELGFAGHYNVTSNPIKFLQKQDLMTLQNFFEVTPNQYTNY